MLDPETILILVGVFSIAFVFAPIGMGGGMLFVPLFHYGLDWAIDGKLIAVSLTLTAVVSYGSGLAHRKEGYVDDPTVKSALTGAVPGALLGVAIVFALSDSIEPVFKGLSIIMIAWSLYKTVRKMMGDPVQTEVGDEVSDAKLRIGSGIGGALSSILAIGSGVIYVPVLRSFGGLDARIAIGSSLHIMMVVVPVAIITHIAALPSSESSQLIDVAAISAIMMIATLVGSRLGAKFGIRYVSEERIMQVFSLILVFLLGRYAWDLLL